MEAANLLSHDIIEHPFMKGVDISSGQYVVWIYLICSHSGDTYMYSREDSLMGWSLDRFGDRSMTVSSPPRADSDLKSTYCFCAHMHEMMKYFQFTEIHKQCLNQGVSNPID